MPKRTDIKSILIIGAGPIVVGQGCEFDYSGTQACKALMAEGYRIILVNSNPATIMTDPDLADATYIEPITPEIVAKIIEKEKPDALLPTMGGQTALNTALTLNREGVLERHGVEMIGAKADAIDMAEDRDLFRNAMARIGLETPRARLANATGLKAQDRALFAERIEAIEKTAPPGSERDALIAQAHAEWREDEDGRKERYRNKAISEAFDALVHVGLPAIIRPSFTLGGTGGGVAYNREEFLEIVESGLDASPTTEVLVEQSVLGWKEFEMEVVRDADDNCIIVCAIENVDPMGVHTGDSITVAPALTLSDRDYQRMRNASIAVLREIGVDTGGSNVQFAVNPRDGRMVVIEMNPRVSRSSALASKATGFPIAKIAAKLAVGYTLDELENDITGGVTPASFEPAIDYVVTKIPRFAFEKFPGAEPTLTTAMKSVGEVMAIGATFQESLQKALRSLETGLTGLDEIGIDNIGEGDDKNAMRAALSSPTPDRILKVAQCLRLGMSHEQVFESCAFDPWFIAQLQGIVDAERDIRSRGLPQDADNLRALKAMGFSDARLAQLSAMSEKAVGEARETLGVFPAYRRIDTCAAEFAAPTAYMYSTYDTRDERLSDDEAAPSSREKVIILGGGPNRIGQGIEFDYCCCHAAFALGDAGIESIMINCNPETVSTDYDTSDRLYFEPLTGEDVLEIVRVEQRRGTLKGVIVQFGGQTPLKLAHVLQTAGVPILGTAPDAIDLAEDRDRFKSLLDDLDLRQPQNGIATNADQARAIRDTMGYPLVMRPSYVLGGRAMEIVHDDTQFERYIDEAVQVSGDTPVLIDRYLHNATEVDVDALCDGTEVFVCGIMEHIEEAGIHSGDSACSLPPHTLSAGVVAELERQTKALASALGVVGLMNAQFAIRGEDIFVLEVNPRASRTVPFVAKTIAVPVARVAARIMAGARLRSFALARAPQNHIAVKEAVFPFNRFPGVDTVLGPEMRSTGEVMGLDRDFARAYAKSQLAAGNALPRRGTVFVSIKDADKSRVAPYVARLAAMGFAVLASGGTERYFTERGIECRKINKVLEGRPHVVDAMKNGDIQLVFNTTEGAKSHSDSRSIRQTAVSHKIPYHTTVAGIAAATEAIETAMPAALEVAPLQSYVDSDDQQTRDSRLRIG